MKSLLAEIALEFIEPLEIIFEHLIFELKINIRFCNNFLIQLVLFVVGYFIQELKMKLFSPHANPPSTANVGGKC